LCKIEKSDKRNKVNKGYSAKLNVNKNVIRDEFPEWRTAMQMSRIPGLEIDLTDKNQESIKIKEGKDKDIDPV
jgi:hypothetical protein